MSKGGPVEIQIDASQFERTMKGYVSQAPFAMSLAINRMAKNSCVPGLKQSLPGTFTIRSKWTERGITFQPSTKVNLTAVVGSRSEYMRAQVEGGEKTPKPGHSTVAVPLVGPGRARPNERSITRPSKWPGALAQRGNVFIGVAGRKSSGGKLSKRKKKLGYTGGDNRTLAVWRRLPKHRLKMVYSLKDKVDIKGRWDMAGIVRTAVKNDWDKEARAAIQYAIKTYRQKRGDLFRWK